MSHRSPARGGRSRERLGYNFAPVPLWLRTERIEGCLSQDDFDLASFLYGRADWEALAARRPTPRLSLAQVAEGVCWRGTDAALSKRLQRARATGVLNYTAERGARGGYFYTFTLYPDGRRNPVRAVSELEPPGLSELDEAVNPHGKRVREGTATESGRAEKTGGQENRSARIPDLSELETGARPLPQPREKDGLPVAVRAAQNDQREIVSEESDDHLLGEETKSAELTNNDRFLDEFARLPRDRDDDRGASMQQIVQRLRHAAEQRNGTEGEDAVLMDAQALVDAGLAEWREDG